jgi:hypothetical protein
MRCVDEDEGADMMGETFEAHQDYRRRHGMPPLTAAEWDEAVEEQHKAVRAAIDFGMPLPPPPSMAPTGEPK